MNEPDTLYLGRLVDEQNQLTDQPVKYPHRSIGHHWTHSEFA